MSIDPVTMEELLATETAQRSLRPLRVGETVEGTIAAVAGHEATVDLGDLPAGVIPLHEIGSDQLRVGERVIAVVTQPEGADGRVVLSLRRARNRKQWVELEEMVDVGLRGFVPLSQLVSIGAIDTHERGVPEAVKALVGRRPQVRVLEADPTRDRLLSEKAATQQLRDVGVADGLVHRSEITWEKGVDPTSPRRLGDAVQVVVVGVDRERQRISLSIKRLGADPWERFVDQLATGQTIDATLTRVMPYGAFARVADGVEGLIHVSEFGVPVCPPPGTHMKRCPQGGHSGSRTYNRNQMMPAPIYVVEEL